MINHELMERYIHTSLSAGVLKRALKEISPTETTPMRVVFAVDANTMAEAYVQCEYQDAKIDLGKQAFKSYVRVGEEIRQALSTFRLSKKVRQVLSPLPT